MISLKTKLTVIVPGKLTEAAFGPGNEDKPGKITEEVEWLINTEYIRYNELLPCVKNICKMWLPCFLIYRLWVLHRKCDTSHKSMVKSTVITEWHRRKAKAFTVITKGLRSVLLGE